MTDPVELDIQDHIAVVSLNRPDKFNALNMDVFRALIESGDEIIANRSVRAVVLKGNGENFCAGIDVSIFSSGELGDPTPHLLPQQGSIANFFQRSAYVWREVPVPVIGALHGIVYGGGLQIALGADLRYCTPASQFSIMEIKWGLIPDMSITTTLARQMPADKLRELAFTGRVFDGKEAAELGVVTEVVEDAAAKAAEIAANIAGRSPDAIRAMKQLFGQAEDLDAAAALRLEAELQASVMGQPNQIEAVMANMERRAPKFSDPE
ncbi:MAG: crotonase/enoyl-CoA hydratase family protein [Pseudomonadota bacterium]